MQVFRFVCARHGDVAGGDGDGSGGRRNQGRLFVGGRAPSGPPRCGVRERVGLAREVDDVELPGTRMLLEPEEARV